MRDTPPAKCVDKIIKKISMRKEFRLFLGPRCPVLKNNAKKRSPITFIYHLIVVCKSSDQRPSHRPTQVTNNKFSYPCGCLLHKFFVFRKFAAYL